MPLSRCLSGVILTVAMGALGLTGALSLRAEVEPLYAVLRGILAFMAVLAVGRWSATALDSLGPITGDRGGSPPSDGPVQHSERRKRRT